MSYHILHKLCAFLSIRLYKLAMWFSNLEVILKEKREKRMKKKDVIFWFLIGFIFVYTIGFFLIKEKMQTGYITIGTAVCMPILTILSAGISWNLVKGKDKQK